MKEKKYHTGKREDRVVSINTHEKIDKENGKIIAISIVFLFAISISIGILFEVRPTATNMVEKPNTIYYGNEWQVDYSEYDFFHLKLGELYTTWTFVYNTNGGSFVLDENTFFHSYITHAWFSSASINGQSITSSASDLHATVDFSISDFSGTLISKVIPEGDNEVGVYGYLAGSSISETFIFIPTFDD
jgi:hypothetical protein